MPFTFPSHAAAVMPLCRASSRLPPGALIIGTCGPDISYLLATDTNFHVWPGVLWPGVPVTAAAWVVGELMVWPSLRRTLPTVRGVDLRRFFATRGLPKTWQAWLWALAALLIGIASHVTWDAFTHGLRYPASALYSVGVAEALQQASTLVGAAVVSAAARRAYPTLTPQVQTARFRVELMLLGAVVGAALLLTRSRTVLWHVFWYPTRGAALGLLVATAVETIETIVRRAEAR